MKLEHFVSETLRQIINGVISAQEMVNTDAKINPVTARFNSNTEGHAFCQRTGVPLQKVEFDVAVTVTEDSASSSGGAAVGSISVSPASSSSFHNTSVSRIRFEVPLLLPTTGENNR